jgi:hypothetical protein
LLSSLLLGNCGSVRNETLLSSLSVGGSTGVCKGLTDDGILLLADRSTLLSCLDVSHVFRLTNTSIGAVLQSMTSLTSLNVRFLFKLSDSLFEAMPESLPNLKELLIGGCGLISDKSVRRIASSCLALETIDLSHCEELSDESLFEIARHCTNIKDLNLTGCKLISDVGIARLAQCCYRLISLEIGDCQMINSIDFLTKGCVWLKQLNVQRTNISDQTLDQLLAFGCIQTLDVRMCDRLTDLCFESILNCNSLRLVRIGNSRMNLNAIERMKEQRKDLEIDFDSNDRSPSPSARLNESNDDWKKSRFDWNSFIPN